VLLSISGQDIVYPNRRFVWYFAVSSGTQGEQYLADTIGPRRFIPEIFPIHSSSFIHKPPLRAGLRIRATDSSVC